MTKTLEQFKVDTLGQSLGNPGTNTWVGQCVSYVRQYMEQVEGVKTGIYGNASDFYNNANVLANYVHVPAGQEQNGDILCWGNDAGTMTGPEGHIAIRYAPGKILNQNYGGTLRVSINNFFSAGYQGALRRKTTNQPQGGNDVPVKINLDTSRILAHGVLARNGVSGRQNALTGSGDADLSTNHVGKDLTNEYVQGLFLSGEGRQWRDTQDANSVQGINARLAVADASTKDDWPRQIATLQTQLAAANTQIATLKAQPVAPPGTTIDQATKDQITSTSTGVTWLVEAIKSIFNRK